MDTLEEIINEEAYRDSIATVDQDGKRIWIYPRKPKGYFHNWRKWVTAVLLAVFFITPLLKVNGHPVMMFNIFERTFIFFGRVFTPHDFYLVAIGGITFFVFIILFTVAFGRIWCGWACPQTLFMEMVFRKIEYWIEGDANQQRKLNARPWDADKILRKTAKQVIFVAFSLLIAHTAMAYLIGLDKTLEIISRPPSENLSGFIGLMAFTFVFYGVFAYLREQACIAVCPYGRLQGVLLGKDSIVISYDTVRGEPRGKLRRKAKVENQRPLTIEDLVRPEGDCIDCGLCVQVCPTGIDIRNGTQLECVNCTACIDACDTVMEKIDKPTGLIRYASYNEIVSGKKFRFTPRLMAYTAVLVLLLGVLGSLLIQRSPIQSTILRVPGALFQEAKDGQITNIYQIHVTNNLFEDKTVSLRLKDIQGTITIASGSLTAEASSTTSGVFVVSIPATALQQMKTNITMEVIVDGEVIQTKSTTFIGPM